MKGRLNSTSTAAAAIALAFFTGGAAMGQTLPDPLAPSSSLVCVTTDDGAPIPLGTEVKDQAGEDIGSVSIGQCSLNPGPGQIRVAMRYKGDFRIRIVSLRDARMDQGQLKLAAPVQDILALAPEASLVDAAARIADVPSAPVSPPRPAPPRTGASSIRR